MIADEENITLFANCRAIKVEMKGEKLMRLSLSI